MGTNTCDEQWLEGMLLGSIERRYGLMASCESIVIREVIGRSGDLAVADRLGFLAASERRVTVAVIEQDGWFVACTTDRTLTASDLDVLVPGPGSPRLMSLATSRGITPVLGPLVA